MKHHQAENAGVRADIAHHNAHHHHHHHGHHHHGYHHHGHVHMPPPCASDVVVVTQQVPVPVPVATVVPPPPTNYPVGTQAPPPAYGESSFEFSLKSSSFSIFLLPAYVWGSDHSHTNVLFGANTASYELLLLWQSCMMCAFVFCPNKKKKDWMVWLNATSSICNSAQKC